MTLMSQVRLARAAPRNSFFREVAARCSTVWDRWMNVHEMQIIESQVLYSNKTTTRRCSLHLCLRLPPTVAKQKKLFAIIRIRIGSSNTR